MDGVLQLVEPMLEHPEAEQQPDQDHHQDQARAEHAHSAPATHLLLPSSSDCNLYGGGSAGGSDGSPVVRSQKGFAYLREGEGGAVNARGARDLERRGVREARLRCVVEGFGGVRGVGRERNGMTIRRGVGFKSVGLGVA